MSVRDEANAAHEAANLLWEDGQLEEAREAQLAAVILERQAEAEEAAGVAPVEEEAAGE